MDIKNKILLSALLVCMTFISNGWAQSVILGQTTYSPKDGNVTYSIDPNQFPSSVSWTISTTNSNGGTPQRDSAILIPTAGLTDPTSIQMSDIKGCSGDIIQLVATFEENCQLQDPSAPNALCQVTFGNVVTVNDVQPKTFTVTVTDVVGAQCTLSWTIDSSESCSGISSYNFIDDNNNGGIIGGFVIPGNPSTGTITRSTTLSLQGCSEYQIHVDAVSNNRTIASTTNAVSFGTAFVPPSPPPSSSPSSITRKLPEVIPAGSDSTIIAINTINLFSGFSVTTNNSSSISSIGFKVIGSGGLGGLGDTCVMITPRSIARVLAIPLPAPDKSLTHTNNPELSGASSILIYPNPTNTGRFNVQINNTPSTNSSVITISNMLGSAIYSNTFTGTTITVSLPAVEPGVYLVSIKNGTNNLVQKLVVQ